MITLLSRAEVDELAARPLTYPEVGDTAGVPPTGYRTLERRETIGRGRGCFEAAGAALLGWRMQDHVGLDPRVQRLPMSDSDVACLSLGWRRLAIPVPVRVVYVVDSPRRRGFAYGTLTGHPERGEELFLAEHHDDDSVSLTVSAFSSPGRWFTRLSGPLGRTVQLQMTRRYIEAVRRLAAGVP